jgi:neutral ceramidase
MARGARDARAPVRAFALSFAALAIGGCTALHGVIPRPDRAEGSGHVRVGAARVDVTTPPGFPMGGHSWAGRIARGHWLRLKARALWIEGEDGQGVALVSTDLWAMPEGLTDRVAEILVRWHVPIDRDRLLLAATHTHHSPAAYSSDRFFTIFAGTRVGFDPRLHKFLAWRIAAAVKQAFDAREPAQAVLVTERVPGLVRNRSMEAFARDVEAGTVLAENADLPLCEPHPLYPDPLACRAIDPRVTVVRFERWDGSPIAIAAFLAGHPTVMSHESTLYGSDVFGAAALTVERHLGAQRGSSPKQLPVVALFNGAEGDVSFTWDRQARPAVLALSDTLAGAIVRAVAAPGTPVDGTVRAARARIRLPLACAPGNASPRCTALFGFPGRATMCGAEDGRSGAPDFVSHEGIRGLPWGPQGTKVGALEIGPLRLLPVLTGLVTGLIATPPRTVPLSVVQVGPLALVAVPGEFTTVLGRRIRHAVAAEAEPFGVHDVLLVGLANGYVLYSATPEEYSAQHYEGSQTLYGPAQGPVFVDHLRELAANLPHARPRNEDERYLHQLVPLWSFTPSRAPAADVVCDAGTRFAFTPVASVDFPVRKPPNFCWNDTMPRLEPSATPVVPEVAIEVDDGGGRWSPLRVDGLQETDDGPRFVTLASRLARNQVEWCTSWLPPAGIDASHAFRFRVGRATGDVSSEPFRLVPSAPAWCEP